MQTPCDSSGPSSVWSEKALKQPGQPLRGIPTLCPMTGSEAWKWNDHLQDPKTTVSPSVLETDGNITCLSAIHVSFQTCRPHLWLHAGVKIISSCYYMSLCVCVCFLNRRNLRKLTYLSGRREQVACCFTRGEINLTGVSGSRHHSSQMQISGRPDSCGIGWLKTANNQMITHTLTLRRDGSQQSVSSLATGEKVTLMQVCK